ncbi:MAG: peptidylprolyl isomerase [Burkholderiaceae bacterium]
MKIFTTPRLLVVLLCLLALAAFAQALRAPVVPAPASSALSAQLPSDYIVALVNSEPITNQQVRLEVQRVLAQMAQPQSQRQVDTRELTAQVVERLINEKAQLQLAREMGLKIEETAVDDAEQNIARQNQVSVAEVYRRLAAEGVDRNRFRSQLRDQLLIFRVREREMAQKGKVSELEIDQYLRDRQRTQDVSAMDLDLAHILIALPDEPSEAQIGAAQAKAQRLLDRARDEPDFLKLAQENSEAGDAANGGHLGMRPAERHPALFVEAARGLGSGDLAVVRSGAGYHVIKVLEKRAPGMPATARLQTRASHILLRLSPQLSESAARERLAAMKRQLEAGQADFAALAKENSQDGSAAQGGDLGWTGAGTFVPEFEGTMNALAPGQISEPLVSRFGVHLITVKERRSVPLGQREIREAIRGILREKKQDEAFGVWAQELRARAYVEMRQPPD